ncbi:PD40 domain-containing protein, partial [bacterium]|nr:PD40 domain-containing protein [bacterium]
MRVFIVLILSLCSIFGQSIQSPAAVNSPDSSTSVDSVSSPPLEISAPTNITELNSAQSDFAPFITADGKTIYFASSRDGGIGGEDIYFSHWEKGRWTNPRNMGMPVNSKYNEGSMCISPDGEEMFLTICGRPDSYGGCDIYVCRKNGDRWGEPKNLGKNVNSSWWDGHPTLSPSGDTLYFASDRYGGFGGIDLYFTYRTKKGWSKPKNVGFPINNARDQTSPFL